MFSIRLPSAAADPALAYANDQSETWSSLTGQLWDQFFGGADYARNNMPRQPLPKASDITEAFESLYMKMPKRLPGKEEFKRFSD